MEPVTLNINGDTAVLANQYISLSFTRAAGWQLSSLKNLITGYEHIAQQASPGPLWRLQALVEYYRKIDVVRIWENDVQQEKVDYDSTAPAELESSGRYSGHSGILLLRWAGVSIADEVGAVDVEVEISLNPEQPYAEWTLRVTSHSSRVGMERVEFPVIGPLAALSSAELAVPNGWGQLIPNPSQSKGYHGHFPCGTCDMQAANLCDSGSGLYLAAHDPRGADKEIVFSALPEQNALSYHLVTHPSGMGTVGLGQDYALPYAAATGAFAGNWLAGAKLYRSWLPNAIWWPKQPIAERTDTPQWVKETALWLQSGGSAEQAVPRARAFTQFFDVPAATHWYSWHMIPFDDHYPEYFPAKPGFAEGVKSMREMGIKVMPYINGRLWDPRNDSWREEKAASACAKDSHGLKYVEVYASKVALAVMCPTTALWQQKIASTVQRLISEYGVNAVYIDQISAAPAKLCYDTGHPHAPGGGDFWVRGYRELLTRTREMAKAADPDAMLTTEDAAEPFADLLDAFLMCNSTRDQLIPFYPAVYSGRSLTFGRYIFKEDMADISAFATKTGQLFVFGAQLGWLSAEILEPAYERQAVYLRTLARIRYAATEYLALGELLGFPEITPAPNTLHTCWNMMNPAHEFRIEPLIPISLPQVIGSVWRANNGSIGVVLTNMGETACSFSWGLGAGDFRLQGTVKVKKLEDGCNEDLPGLPADRFSISTQLAPYSACLYVLETRQE